MCVVCVRIAQHARRISALVGMCVTCSFSLKRIVSVGNRLSDNGVEHGRMGMRPSGLRTPKVVLRVVWLCSFQSASLRQTHAWHSLTPRVDSSLSGSPSLADAPSSSAPMQIMHLMRTRPRSMNACGLDYQHPLLIRMLSGSEI